MVILLDMTSGPGDFHDYPDGNARFFTDTLPGQEAAVRSPTGAYKLGPLADDAVMAFALSQQEA